MTTLKNVNRGRGSAHLLWVSDGELGSKDTEKHVQDSEVYFKNFLVLKRPQFPRGAALPLPNSGKVGGPSSGAGPEPVF